MTVTTSKTQNLAWYEQPLEPTLPDYIIAAHRSGYLPPYLTNWRDNPALQAPQNTKKFQVAFGNLTLGQKVIYFCETTFKNTSAEAYGAKLKLTDFQEVLFLSIFDAPDGYLDPTAGDEVNYVRNPDGSWKLNKKGRRIPTRTHATEVDYSVGRRNGKTFVNALLQLSFMLFTPLRKNYAHQASGAMNQKQAKLLFNEMVKLIDTNEQVKNKLKITDHKATIEHLETGTVFSALSSEGKSQLGMSLRVVTLDEAGAIEVPSTDFTEMLGTSFGSYRDGIFINISTNAPDEISYLSQRIDASTAEPNNNRVCFTYEVPEHDPETGEEIDVLNDETYWHFAQPLILHEGGGHRSMADIRSQANKAKRIPATERKVLNLIFNRRVAQEGRWLSPRVWRANNGSVPLSVFSMARSGIVYAGLDLSTRNDLSSVCFATERDGRYFLKQFSFTPKEGLKDREQEHKQPYQLWIDQGHLIVVPERVISYKWVCEWIRKWCMDNNVRIRSVNLDSYRIDDFKSAAQETSFEDAFDGALMDEKEKWFGVHQTAKSMNPRLEAFETALSNDQINHGDCPLLTMGARNAVEKKDGNGYGKLEKSQDRGKKIDPLQAAVQALYPLTLTDSALYAGDVSWMIG